jgi:tetratricopeptide (TPR) repeat protein
VVLLIAVLVFSAIKSTDIYKLSLQQVQSDPVAQQQLGTPIVDGYLVSGKVNVQDNSGSASFRFPVSGPKGSGTASVQATLNNGQWTITSLVLEVNDQPVPVVIIGTGVLKPSNSGDSPSDPARAVKLHERGVKAFAASLRNPEQRDGAVALLEEALRNDPGNDVLKLDVADAYVLTGHEVAIAYAIDLYEDLLTRRPQEDALIARLADAFGELENYDDAFRLVEQRLALPKPNVRGAAMQATILALDSRQLDRGQRLLTELSARNPNEPGVRLLLASLLSEGGWTVESRAVIQDARKGLAVGDPLYLESERMLARLTP